MQPLTVSVPLTANRVAVVSPRWHGRALMVHAPIVDGAETLRRGVWIVAHQGTGLSAGAFRGPLRDAVKLARLWDAAFADAVSVDANGAARSLAQWPQRRAWSRQCAGETPATGPVDASHPDHNNGEPVDRLPTLPPLPRRGVSPVVRERETVATLDGDGSEQFPATPTLAAVVVDGERRVRFSRRLPDGRERLRNPETGAAVRMDGDVAAFANGAGVRLRLWFAGAWCDVPSIAELMEWSLDGVAETPDGSRVEPDAPKSWLTLLGVV